ITSHHGLIVPSKRQARCATTQCVAPQGGIDSVRESSEAAEERVHQGAAKPEVISSRMIPGVLPPDEPTDYIPVAKQRGAESQPDTRVMPAAHSEANRQQYPKIP